MMPSILCTHSHTHIVCRMALGNHEVSPSTHTETPTHTHTHIHTGTHRTYTLTHTKVLCTVHTHRSTQLGKLILTHTHTHTHMHTVQRWAITGDPSADSLRSRAYNIAFLMSLLWAQPVLHTHTRSLHKNISTQADVGKPVLYNASPTFPSDFSISGENLDNDNGKSSHQIS